MTPGAHAAAVVPAAGRGERLGGALPKSLMLLGGRPLVQHSLETLQGVPEIEAVVVAVPSDSVALLRDLADDAGLSKVIAVVPGGADRQASVAAGLAALPAGPELVLVHDGARPFLSRRLAADVLSAAARDGSATAALPVGDTIKRGSDGWVQETLDRASLHRIQTPQAFRRALLEQAHQAASRDGYRGTDDAVLVERTGHPVRLVRGDPSNIKITVPEDLALAEAILLRDRGTGTGPRIGIGFDVHRFGGDRPLLLGGVEVPHDRGLVGHSDADVIVHAVMDALLGAAGCGDIGHHFPPTDPAYAGANSLVLMARVREIIERRGWEAAQVDVVVVAESPRLAPYVSAMRAAMGDILGLPPDSVNVKATTMERMGAIGREEGIAVHAVASVRPCPGYRRGGAGA